MTGSIIWTAFLWVSCGAMISFGLLREDILEFTQGDEDQAAEYAWMLVFAWPLLAILTLFYALVGEGLGDD